MKRKGLYLLIALAVGSMGVVHAQSAQDNDTSTMNNNTSMTETSTNWANYDTRWYLAPKVGYYYNDTDRNTNSRQAYYGVSFGRFFTPDFSLDIFADHTHRRRDNPIKGAIPKHNGGEWNSDALGVSGRYYFGSTVRPYVMGGLMANHHRNSNDKGWSAGAQLGGGVVLPLSDNASIRAEAGYRYDADGDTLSSENGYGDWFAGLALVARIGSLPEAPAPVAQEEPAAPPVDCSTLDDDNDGVNNCVDKCADTPAGTIVGPDGCAKPVVIDLRGVNFKFDRPSKGETDIAPTLQEPTADSVAILDQAVDTLTRYAAVKVELDGNTDSIGTEAYNQKLSERRAQIVYKYLTDHGIGADRITAVKGFGEDNPIATNKTKEGRAQNRRTELVVQNPEQPAAESNP